MKGSYRLYFLLLIATGLGASLYMNSFNPEMNNELTTQNVITSKIVELDDKKDIVDIAIKNVIVYPNRFDKKSIYIDIEINNQNGDGFTQITLSNGVS